MNTPKDRLIKAFEDLRYLKKVSSQTDFGDKIGYNKSHISELMNGKKPITNTFAALLQTKFGIMVDWLMDGVGQMKDELVAEKPPKRIQVLGDAAAGGDMQMTYNDTSNDVEYIDVGDLLRDSEAARHSFATRCAELNMSIDDVQKLLGHSKRSSTEIYFRIKSHRLDGAMRKWE